MTNEMLKFYCPKCKRVQGSSTYWTKNNKIETWCRWCEDIINPTRKKQPTKKRYNADEKKRYQKEYYRNNKWRRNRHIYTQLEGGKKNEKT